jgi:sterol desaturase/sphingolipid hydroxylase (fatty acid hydroxylase superfamily)
MQAADILGLMVPVTYFAFLFTERLWPAREFPPRKGWQWIGVAFLLIIGIISVVTPLLLPTDWLAAHRFIDGTRLGVAGGAIVGFVVLEGVVYAYHRAAHRFSFLWVYGGHQVHHGPARVDIPGSVVFHPVEAVIQAVLQIFTTVLILGLDPLAAAIAGYTIIFYTMFQHWNVKTPQWLGYIIQRPEAHCIHHRLGLHYYNFADFPPWDILFGTFRNPKRSLAPVGFDAGADRKLAAMLTFHDVNEALYGPGSRGQQIQRETAALAA